MSLIKANGAGDQSTGFYNGVATQSLRFDGLTSTMQRTLVNSSNGSRRKNVWSFWAKFDTSGLSPFPYFYSKGEGGGVADIIYLRITTNHKLHFIGYISDSVTHQLITTRQFRDPNAWYHIVVAVDTTQSTASNRIQIYVNGVKETAFDTETYPSLNADLAMNWYSTANAGTTIEMISDYRASPNENYRIDGYLADYHSVDGLSFFSDTSGTANSSFNINSFGELNNGVWIPVAYTGSHGTQGYHLKFENTSVGTGSSSTVGADSAGTNHWTTNNINTHDCAMPDCPELNFCTLSGLHLPSNTGNQLLDGGLVADATSTSWSQAPASWAFQAGEKWYWEVSADNTAYYVGVASPDVVRQSANALIGWDNPLREAWVYNSGGQIRYNGANQTTTTAITANDILAFAVDVDGGTLRFYLNNVLKYTASHDFTGWFPDAATINQVYLRHNFGQDGTFAGLHTAQGNSDENGYGDFYYTPPSGYLAMCSANLNTAEAVDPAGGNSPTDYFDVHTYTGTEATHSIEALSFKPDWVWIKQRDTENQQNVLQDSTRGAGQHLYPNLTNSEATATGSISSFDAPSSAGATDGGWTMGANLQINRSGRGYVGWSWKANGGTTSSNTNGSITSTVQANQDAGFSIVTYTGNGTSTGESIGHGLSQRPDIVIIKNRDTAGTGWAVLCPDFMTATQYMALNLTNAITNSANSGWGGSLPDSTKVYVGGSSWTNTSGDDYIAYCFHSVDGYSSINSYTGNGSADGTFIYTGFRPAFVLVKNADVANSWRLWDSARPGYNLTNLYLTPDSTGQEGTINIDVDFLSNGFKLRGSNSGINGSGNNIIYMAFAKAPFKYANAR